MRLTSFEVATINQTAKQVFGDATKIYLFGSRVDDAKKGGDIDLYVMPENKNDLLEKKIQFLSALDLSLGEQKIDVVIAQDENRPIEKEAIAKGRELNIQELRLQKVLSECDKHILRMNDAFNDMTTFMPLSSAKYENLSKENVQAIDQYLFRFAKLQDSMGEKLFRILLDKYQDNANRLSFLDVIRMLEKYLDTDIAAEWLDLRNTRNQLAHEYDDDAIAMANMINLIYAKKEVIEGIYLTIKSTC